MPLMFIKLHIDRRWLAGLSLVACGPMQPSGANGAGESATSGGSAEISTTASGEPTAGPTSSSTTIDATSEPGDTSSEPGDTSSAPPGECVDESECHALGYCFCIDGTCVHCHRPPPRPECYFDEECPDGYVCDSGYCEYDEQPLEVPPCPDEPVELSQWELSQAPSSLGLADLDGDGDLDLFAALPTGAIELAFNDGVGGFAPGGSVDLGAPAPAMQIAAGDFDGDADADLVVDRPGEGALLLLFGQDGTFMPGPTLPSSAAARRLHAIDLEGDGDPDIVVVTELAQVVTHISDGLGGFGPEQTFLVELAGDQVTVQDADDDGFVDILAQRDQDFALYRGGPPAITWEISELRDIDSLTLSQAFAPRLRAGGRELMMVRPEDIGGRVLLWPDTPDGWSTDPLEFSTAERLIGGTLADVDASGFDDVVLATGDPRISVLLADNNDLFACQRGLDVLATTAPDRLAVGDLDADGRDDIVAGSPDSAIVSLLRSP
ncbi:FG-GAP repeat domain-containing protein [Nannocystis radixulma]|uniref:VCBS repeat-containing protein n=1 Tax=Nannocystis radixulma TaxID=2995305 RepID=A0ABT5B3J2_9BACT|nr:VCBS repeat-containing protein [Nannocystis radixulma]MDC0668667.1 VCBS repeat-containing protein [Nannocystis radixulma]